MRRSWVYRDYEIRILVLAGLFLAIASPPTIAQITPDATLGGESSRVTEDVTIRGANGDHIDGGAIRGSNVFHSFSEFNVNEGQRVYFGNPSGISNILSRVTGTDVSDIMGTLGVDGDADLFFLNPNGIIFGPNARLDISGSFTASTGDSVAFPDGTLFSAGTPGDGTVLSVNVPLGVQYGPSQPGPISNSGALTVGQDLRLSGGSFVSTGLLSAPLGDLRVEGVAGDVQISQAVAKTATFSASNTLVLQDSQLQTTGDMNLLAGNTVQLRDSATNPFVAYAANNLTIQGNQGVDILAFSHPQTRIQSGGNLSLISDGLISGDAHFLSGGNFQLRSVSGQLANFTSLYDPIISSTGNVDIAGNYGVPGGAASLLIESQGSVRIQGDIRITTPDTISNFTNSDEVLGLVPGLIIRSGQASLAYGGVNQNNPSAFTNGAIPDGITLEGSIRIEPLAGVLPVTLNGQRGVVNLAAARGNITVADIDASGLNGGGNITLVRGVRGSSGSGNINVVNVRSNVAGGSGFPGRISITNERGSIFLSGTISANGNTVDDPNTIEIAARNGSVNLSGATLTAETNGSGRDITVTASGDVSIRNSTISSTGNFGRIFIGTSPLVLNPSSTNVFRVISQTVDLSNSRLNTRNSSGVTQSGAIIVYATDSIRMRNGTRLNGGGDSSSNLLPARSENSAASIFINAEDIHIDNSTVSSEGGFGRIFVGLSLFACESDCGSSSPNLREVMPSIFPRTISISNGSRLSTQSSRNSPNANSGDIAINARDTISIRNNSTISSEGNDGRISIGSVDGTNEILGSDSNIISQPVESPRIIVLENGSSISTRNVINGERIASVDAGGIDLQATDRISILNRSTLTSDTLRTGNSGNITIEAGAAPVFNGHIVIDQSIVSSQVLRGGHANQSGSVTIRAGALTLAGGGQINTTLNDLQDPNSDPAPRGNAGNVTVNVSGDINISGGNRRAFSGIFSAVGNGNPSTQEDGRFNSNFLGLSFARGNGGRVEINSGSLSIDGSRAGVFTRSVGAGNAGDVFIRTGVLTLSNGGSIDNSTTRFVSSNNLTNGEGDAGNISVRADRIILDNGSINVEAARILSPGNLDSRDGSSRAGNIKIEARDLVFENDSTATVESQFGQAGNLEITAEQIILDNTTLNANAGNAGRARNNANITLTVSGPLLLLEGTRPRSQRTEVTQNALISANAIGSINGGNITIRIEDGFVLANANDNSDITANAFDDVNRQQRSGNGGEVTIRALGIFGLERRDALTEFSDITATSESGATGAIALNTLNIDPTRGLGELPVDIVNAANLVAEGCIGSNRSGVDDQGEFTRTGRGGLSSEPTDTLTDISPIDQLAILEETDSTTTTSIPPNEQPQSLVEAQGLAVDTNGKVSLVPTTSTAPSTSSGLTPTTCIVQ